MPDRSPLRVEKRAPRPSADHQRAIARENLQASALSASDARWAFAVRVASSIDGGKAGILRPDIRRRLLTQASHLGLRPFDANLIIAIVQDSARSSGQPLDDQAASRLKLVRDPSEAGRRRGMPIFVPMAASLLAIALAWTIIQWLRG